MAVLEKIRSRAGLLVGVIALALFAFVIQGLFDPNNSIFGARNRSIGEINGHSVSGEEFMRKLTDMEEKYKRNNGLASIDDNTRQQLINQVWNDYLDQYLYDGEIEDAGIGVSDEELVDLVQGDNIDPQLKSFPMFQDSITKQFDRSRVVKFINNQLNEDNDPDGMITEWWTGIEQMLKKQRLKSKYNTLVKKAMYVTTSQAKRDFSDKNNTAEYRIVAKKYDALPDSAVTVTDNDLRKYYDEHNFEFEQQEESRKIEYVVFQVNPSAEDRRDLSAAVERQKEEFASTSNDTSFVNAASSEPFAVRYVKRGQLGPQIDSAVFAGPVGSVYGPYVEGEHVKLVKLREFKAVSDSVKARHILISTREGLDPKKAVAKADSLKSLVKSGTDFALLAIIHSEDPGSKNSGGDLGWFTEGRMVPSFNDACFNGKAGDLVVVESEYGAHLIHIQEKTRPYNKAGIIYLTRNIEPSTKTTDMIYAQANDFAVTAQDYEAFKTEAEAKGYSVSSYESLRASERSINELVSARELVQWAYHPDREINEVSKVFDLDGKYVVATLTGIKSKGIPTFDQLKEQIRPLAVRAKKAERFSDEFRAALSSSKSIDELAAKMKLTSDTIVRGIHYSTYSLDGHGQEPKVIGALFAGKAGVLSQPVRGNSGVYVYYLVKDIEIAALPENLKDQKQRLASGIQGRVESTIYPALSKKANIEDKRALFF